MTKKGQVKNKVDYVSVAFMLLLALSIGVSYLWWSESITIAIIFLIGIWAIDVYLKHQLNLAGKTTYADLSFVSLIFVTSRGVASITTGLSGASSQTTLISTFIIAFILGIFWIVNLSMSRHLEYPIRANHQRRTVVISICFSCLSSLLALIAQSRGLI